ncbi:MAG: thioredoxin domain-containing protein [Kiritimatiellae bacterium]|nr:thioredoxin domain-containing protein [Kiritimatiellia bacterium]MDW8458485.1 thioredoxin domain-containing protein [Verrucomicrobiota bacterium]
MADEHRPHSNRLIHETSPYLRQHATNPVDWYPWGEEALNRAKLEDKPIFLSIGYSACHWCHVMERESFENPEIAEILNRHFVSVKVDREERPDLDEFYMLVTQIMTGRGGWPNSVWLLPDGRPWYAGTYFPPEDRWGRIGFKTLLLRLAEIWRTRRADIEEQARQIISAMKAAASRPAPEVYAPHMWDSLFRRARQDWLDHEDREHGGPAGAPKFPPHTALGLILDSPTARSESDLDAYAFRTLDAMALGGIRDHIGGGFHRYSTDERWLLPHFEKMLYDNAQLARAYSLAAARSSDPRRRAEYEAAARETLDWLLEEMTDREGGFYSSLDADSDGEEGKYYVWSHEEIVRLLGTDAADFCRLYNVRIGGNYFEEATGHPTGLNILHLTSFVDEPERSRMTRCRAVLKEARKARVRPACDDKIITSWNGLAIAALASAAQVFADRRYLAAAEAAARSLLQRSVVDGELMRIRQGNRSHVPAFLEDYAALTWSLLCLNEATRDASWLEAAERLGRHMIDHFADPLTGMPWSVGPRHETLPVKIPDVMDQSQPSPVGLAIRVWAILAERGGGAEFRRAAERALAAAHPLAARAPSASASVLHAALFLYRNAANEAVSWKVRPLARSAAPGGVVALAVEADVPAGWTLQPYEGGAPFRVETGPPFDLVSMDSSTVRLRMPQDPAGLEVHGVIRLYFRPCNSTECLPERQIEFPVSVAVTP